MKHVRTQTAIRSLLAVLASGLVVAVAMFLWVGCGGAPSGGPASDTGTQGPDSATTDRDADPEPNTDTGATAPPALGGRVFFLGHSLQGWQAPAMMTDFAAAQGLTYEFRAAIGIGANLAWQWTHPDRAEGDNPRVTLAGEPFEVLVMTEAIPLADQLEWAESATNASNFLRLALEQNPNVRSYLYETWDHLTVDDWRGQLDSDRALWNRIVDDVNETHSGPDMLLIPGGRAMAALYDAIAAGDVPGVSDHRQLFVDDIHLTDIGWYFIACVQYATIYRRSPVGVPAATTDRFGQPIAPPPAGAAPVLQRIAWDVVRTDDRAGVAQ